VPLSDEDRLERVYAKAGAMKLARRARVMALASILAVVVGAAVLLSDGPDPDSQVQVADGTPADNTDADSTTTVFDPSTTVSIPHTPTTPTVATSPTTPVPTTRPTTTTTTAPPKPENCGGYFPGGAEQSKPPDGMVVTVEASKQTVRRGDDISFTLRARWTGSQPLTYSQSGRKHLIYATWHGQIFYSSQYDDATPATPAGPDTFQPGEEKTYTARWDTSLSCGTYPSMQKAAVPTGTYVVYGSWESTSGWNGQPAQFELTP
jgi:hypothetical protein